MKSTQPEPRLWRIEDVAEHIGCTPRHVNNLMAAGLPYLKIGRLLRFDPEEITRHLRESRIITTKA